MRGVTRILGRSLTRSWIGASRARACACRPALGALDRVEPLPGRALDQPAQPREYGEAPSATHVGVRLGLQERAPGNLRRLLEDAVRRIATLFLAELATVGVMPAM